MASAYTKVAFTDSAKGITATKLNLLRDDLSAAISTGSGTPGPAGPPGPTGPQGPAGPTGPQGPAGSAFSTTTTAAFSTANAPTAVTINLTTTTGLAPGAVLYINGAGYYQVQSVTSGTVVTAVNASVTGNAAPGTNVPSGASVLGTGPQGPPGATGATGPQGPIGNTGSTGATGPQGPIGNTGATGPQGPIGNTGPAGSTGATGAAATIAVGTTSTGAAGSNAVVTNVGTSSAAVFNFTIPQGIQGAQGAQGNTGPQGPIGNTGPTGPQGATGATGSQGPAGSTGPTGATGQGYTWRGAWVNTTAYVPYDTVSRSGSSYVCILANTGGDPATDTTHWSIIAQIGATGPTGAQGPQGTAGTTGATGPAGPTGATGPQGPPGTSANPGTWTNLSLGAGWTAPTQAQYRVEVNGAVSTVYFRGMIQAAYSAMGTTAFTAPAGALPSMTRSAVLAGAQNTGTPSDVASYIASVASSGVCTIYFLGAGPFVWADPAQTQQVYLDGLSYSL
jgi:collagen type I alpha